MRAIRRPKPPAAYVDATAPEPLRTVHVAENLQAAIDVAVPGDELVLEPGVTYWAVTLPNIPAGGWVTVRSAAELPSGRVRPEHSELLPKIVGPVALQAAPRAHHFRFVGVEFAPASGQFSSGLVRLGSGQETTKAQLPHHIVLDRCYVHGDQEIGGRRGVVLNGKHLAVVNSWLSDWKEEGADSQAIAGWNGSGPFLIQNCHLEAAGENVMFGGADPKITNLVPSDILIYRCHFYKPQEWKGSEWNVLNLLETKNARRVWVHNNLFDGCWEAVHSGHALNIKSVNQTGTAPWCVSEDIMVELNVFRNVEGGVKVAGISDQPGQQARRIEVANNYLEVGGYVDAFRVLNAALDVTIDHNTVVNNWTVLTAEGQPSPRLTFINNIVNHNGYGVKGGGTGIGNPTIAAFFPNVVFERNVMHDADLALYPAGNYAADTDDLGTDGFPLGAAIDADAVAAAASSY